MSIEIDGKSLDVKAEKLTRLKELFPEFFSEGKIDIARVKQLLGDEEIAGQDHYELSWAGKAEARREIQRQTTATLLPDREGSINFDTSENIFIEGENLEVLRTLQKSYFGEVKMIYIDPPYNTGSDSFIYPDDYAERKEDYEKRIGQKNGEGYLNKLDLFRKNTKENGQYHSVWLSMMYPRLYLAKNLLSQDGVIFVSIDDNEIENLKLLMDEIFGSENYIATFYIKVRYEGKTLVEDKSFQKLVECVLVYSKTQQFKPQKESSEYTLDKFIWKVVEKDVSKTIEIEGKKVEVFEPGNYEIIKDVPSDKHLKEIWASGKVLDGNSSGRFFRDHLSKRVGEDGLNIVYKVYGIGDDGLGYRYFTNPKKETATKGKYYQGVPTYVLENIENSIKELPIVTFYDFADAFGNCRHEGNIDFRNGKKPIRFLQSLLEIVELKNNDIVLDFFAGSCSIAHAILDYNATADNGLNLRFICAQMPEPLDEESDSHKAGLRTVSDIGKKRIQNVIASITAELNGKLEYNGNKRDLGFRAYKLFYSNFKKWQSIITDKDELLKQLEIFKEPLANRPTDSYDLLVELLLKSGLPLSVKAEKRETSDNVPFYVVGNGQLIYALDNLSDSLLKDIEAAKPKAFITLGNLFTGEKADEQMTNWKLQLKESNIEFKII